MGIFWVISILRHALLTSRRAAIVKLPLILNDYQHKAKREQKRMRRVKPKLDKKRFQQKKVGYAQCTNEEKRCQSLEAILRQKSSSNFKELC